MVGGSSPQESQRVSWLLLRIVVGQQWQQNVVGLLGGRTLVILNRIVWALVLAAAGSRISQPDRMRKVITYRGM